MVIEEGCILFGKYRIIKCIGQGGFSKVFLARHIKLDVNRAIKCILKEDMLYEQLMREISILRSVRNENIPLIYDIEEDEDSAYIIEEFCEGESLKEYAKVNNSISINTVYEFSLQIGRLLEYLHSHKQRILYLDLKPDNLIISNDTIKLVDFGASIYSHEQGQASAYMGSVAYSSPEQKMGKSIDNRSDIYSFGVIMQFMMDNLVRDSDKKGNLYKSYIRILTRCTKGYPMFRYGDMKGVIEDLSKAVKTGTRKTKEKECAKYKAMRIAVCEGSRGAGAIEVGIMLVKYLCNHMSVRYVDVSDLDNVRRISCHYQLMKNENGSYDFEDIALSSELSEGEECVSTIFNYGANVYDVNPPVWDCDLVMCICPVKSWQSEATKKMMRYLNICDNLAVIAICSKDISYINNEFGICKGVYVMPDTRERDFEGKLSQKEEEFIEQILEKEGAGEKY